MYKPVASTLEEAEDSQGRNPELKSGVKGHTGTVLLPLPRSAAVSTEKTLLQIVNYILRKHKAKKVEVSYTRIL